MLAKFAFMRHRLSVFEDVMTLLL